MTECDQIGIRGRCGFDCRVFLRGECDTADEMIEDASHEDFELYLEIYGE